jgi:hypothetical protein
MALRSSALKDFRFDTRLGPIQTQVLPAEDGELVVRLRGAGHRGVGIETARVKHFIAKERLRLRIYLRRSRCRVAPPGYKMKYRT